ncbi:MAG: Tex family protein [Chitinophagaceae bacterium]
MSHFAIIASELKIKQSQVETVVSLLTEGNTIPFIARYRKDKTGSLDEVQIEAIQQKAKQLQEFDDRKAAIVKSITDQEKMTDELLIKINATTSIAQLEDLYLPYKPKRKTKAQTARENGLEPLAQILLKQTDVVVKTEAAKYLNDVVKTEEEALQGARDIIAEQVNEDAIVREKMRFLFNSRAKFISLVLKDKEVDGVKYKDYFNFSEPISTIPSHRTLAILRGFLEGFLKMSIEPLEEDALELLENLYLTSSLNESVTQVKKALRDCYVRLLQPSLETECRNNLKTAADEEAINVFAENLKQLLLSSPLGSKRLIAIDPGYRTGCKIVVLDEFGNLLHNDLIYIHEKNKLFEAEQIVRHLINKYNTQAFAIGDGTAGRETEQFIKSLQISLPIFMVNEDGASIYSASETGREEFPNHDVTVRGAVSIGRRLMDPLAELVKLEPKSIGVGQYQHDVNQFRLKEKLDQTVINCVNQVGVNLNTASKHLLSYVSGIGNSIAENIVTYRKENGEFKSRNELLKVARLGNKAFEQSAGFLRINNSNNALDNSGVHPEAYDLVEKMANDLQVKVAQLMSNVDLVKKIDAKKYATETIGIIGVNDILKELLKPGLDPRSEIEVFEFANIFKIEDVIVDSIIPGVVTNITRFGAFVDIGVKQDGLVHVSEIAHKFISDPNEVLKLNQKVQVKVLEVDVARKRIMLSIKQTQEKTTIKQSFNKNGFQKNNQPQPKTAMSEALKHLKTKF